MLTGSFVTSLGLERAAATNQELKPTSVFWTRADGQMCLQHFRPETDLFFQPHSYSEYTIVICLEGEISKTQLGHTQVIGRGCTLVGNHGVEHTSGYWSRNNKRCEAVVLSVERGLLDGLTAEFNLPSVASITGPAFLGKVENDIIDGCARAISEELRSGLPGHKVVVESIATRILVETMRAWPRSKIEKIAADLSPRLPRREFVRAHEFMRWCRKEHFRLEQLCQFLGSSEERFARLFLASTRHTPASFYNRMLLERARDLLRDSKLSVKEIGYQLGFKTSSHFIAAFRREFSAPPQEYRQLGDFKQSSLQLG
jgi:AraC-like DNA-binding protein